MTLRTLNHGNDGMFLIMGNAGFRSSTVFWVVHYYQYSILGPKALCQFIRSLHYEKSQSQNVDPAAPSLKFLAFEFVTRNPEPRGDSKCRSLKGVPIKYLFVVRVPN